MSEEKKLPRRGGLGKGLAALIPTAPTEQPRVGDAAADIIFGPTKQKRSSGKSTSASNGDSAPLRGQGSSQNQKRNSDVSGRKSAKVEGNKDAMDYADDNVSRETQSLSDGNVADFGASYRELSLDAIVVNENQPRKVFDEEPLKELAHSIKEFGLLQPIVVRPIGDDVTTPRFEIIMGERRWRASQLAGLDTIPAIVRETADENMLRDALLENIHRVQLNPLEEAAAYQQLLEEFDVTQAELAERLGRSRPAITNMIRLLKLPTEVQRRVAAGVLSAGHARALLGLETGADDQLALANRVVAEGMSVRATEEAVTLLNRGEGKAQPRKRKTIPQPEILNTWAGRLADVFDTKVTAQMGKRKGRVVIEFSDLEDFDRIMALMESAGKAES